MTQLKFKPYCTVCGSKTKSETCSDQCKWKLEKIRSIIQTQKESESDGIFRKWDEKTVKDFNRIQEIIG